MSNRYLALEGRPILTGSVIQEVHESISGPCRLRLLRRLLEFVGRRGVRRQFRVLYACGFVRAPYAEAASGIPCTRDDLLL